MDRWLAGQFTAGTLAAKPFTPLPVLGVPGWTAENEQLSFYDDSTRISSSAGRGKLGSALDLGQASLI